MSRIWGRIVLEIVVFVFSISRWRSVIYSDVNRFLSFSSLVSPFCSNGRNSVVSCVPASSWWALCLAYGHYPVRSQPVQNCVHQPCCPLIHGLGLLSWPFFLATVYTLPGSLDSSWGLITLWLSSRFLFLMGICAQIITLWLVLHKCLFFSSLPDLENLLDVHSIIPRHLFL